MSAFSDFVTLSVQRLCHPEGFLQVRESMRERLLTEHYDLRHG